MWAVFKILRLGTDQFEVQNDLRDLPHKQLNLNYSSNDVQWNPKDGKTVDQHLHMKMNTEKLSPQCHASIYNHLIQGRTERHVI